MRKKALEEAERLAEVLRVKEQEAIKAKMAEQMRQAEAKKKLKRNGFDTD